MTEICIVGPQGVKEKIYRGGMAHFSCTQEGSFYFEGLMAHPADLGRSLVDNALNVTRLLGVVLYSPLEGSVSKDFDLSPG